MGKTEKIVALAASFTMLGVTILPNFFTEKPAAIQQEIESKEYTYETKEVVDESDITPKKSEVAPQGHMSQLTLYSEEDIELIALVTIAEAEGEDNMGKRLVIDTILNRVDNENFPDTLYDVIYQRYHFSCVWNGRMERCSVNSEVCDLVRSELSERTNSDVLFFQSGGYSKYGKPLFKLGNHYFSGWEE